MEEEFVWYVSCNTNQHQLCCFSGYSNDGMKVANRGYSKFGPEYRQGDVVGVGLNVASGELFFTKNGELAGMFGMLLKNKNVLSQNLNSNI
jgi:hypothetical protein